MDRTFGRVVDLAALRRGETPPARGQMLVSLGAERLERILYERDELREREALANACRECRAGRHEECLLVLYNEVADSGSDAIGPQGLGPAPSCSCTDCVLGIPEAAAGAAKEGR